MDEGRKEADDRMRLHLLVLRCQAGDDRAFGDLHREFSSRTLRYLKGLMDETRAEDVQQEVWLTVFRKLGELTNPGGFRTWLYRVTRHRAIDALRRDRRQPELLTDGDADPADVATAATDSLFELETDVLEPAMAGLTRAHREVLILRFWEDMSYAEMALVVGCSVGTIRSRLHHAKTHVRTFMERRTR